MRSEEISTVTTALQSTEVTDTIKISKSAKPGVPEPQVTVGLTSTEVTDTITISKSEKAEASGQDVTVESTSSVLQFKHQPGTGTISSAKTHYSRLEQVIQHKSYQHVLFKEKFFMMFPLDIEFRQQVNAKLCIAITGAETRCTKTATAASLDWRIAACLEKLKEKQHRIEYHLLKKVLRRMEDPILCNIHHQSVAKHLPSCVHRLINTYKTENEGLAKQLRQAFHYWASEIMEPGKVSRSTNGRAQVPGESIERSIRGQQLDEFIAQCLNTETSSERWNLVVTQSHQMQRSFSAPVFVTKLSSKLLSAKFEDRMKKIITMPLHPEKDKESGYLYVFTFDLAGFDGRYKVGISIDPDIRLRKQWTSHYQMEPRIVFNELDEHVMESKEKRPIPHYKRLERIVHSELKEYGLKQICNGGCTHCEWFEADEDHVIAVARKWCKWMRQEPYDFGRKGKLKIKIENDKDVMKVLCTPVDLQKGDEKKVQGTSP